VQKLMRMSSSSPAWRRRSKARGDEQDETANVNELITSAAEFETQNPEGTLIDYLAR